MSPLHQSNELVLQISPNPHKKHAISEDDLIRGRHDSFHINVFDHINTRKLITTTLDKNNYLNCNTNNNLKKKTTMMTRRETERLRRQEMATLYASLRSLLPPELIKGKRSLSDNITQATNYIKHLENKINDLGTKRDELEKLLNSSTCDDHHDRGISSGSSSSSCSSRLITVHQFSGGIETVITSSSRESSLALSMVMKVLLEEGLSVNNCMSTTINDRLHHTIHTDQVNNLETINLSALEKKLNEGISTS